MRNLTPRIAVALLTFTIGVSLTTGLLAIRYAHEESVIRRAAIAVDVSPLEAAERVARTRDSDPSYLIREVAARYADIGEFDKAINLVNTISDDSEKAVGKAKIAVKLWKVGGRAGALELFNSLRLLDGAVRRVHPG